MKKKDKSKENDIAQSTNDVKNKKKFKVSLKMIIIVVIVLGLTFGMLYAVNPTIKKYSDSVMNKIPIVKDFVGDGTTNVEKEKNKEVLADYYLSLDESRAIDKLSILKSEDLNLYNDIVSKMKQEDLYYTNRILDGLSEKDTKKKSTLDKELESMKKEQQNQAKSSSSYYQKLDLTNSVKALENDILNLNIDFEEASSIIENMKPDSSAKILYYLDANMASSIRKNLSKTYKKDLDMQTFKYENYLDEMKAKSLIFSNEKPEDAVMPLQNPDEYTPQDLAYIFLNMDYLKAAKILNLFEDKNYENEVLESIKSLEDLFASSEGAGTYSTDLNNALEVLDLYESDIDHLRKSYEKMEPSEVAKLVEQMTTSTPKFKQYTLDSGKTFSISEEEMTIDILKGMKPKFVAQIISSLSAEKGAEISRKLGLPVVK